MFVATFIGSPAMNVFPAEVVKDDGKLKLVFEENELTLPPERIGKLGTVVGQTVMAGIRPEHLMLKNGVVPEGDTTMQLPVNLVEPLGSETLVHMHAPGGEMIVARIDPSAHVKVGDRIDLLVDPARIYAFDAQTEEALN
jgi:multiple sugar transport system ATP-binding protein